MMARSIAHGDNQDDDKYNMQSERDNLKLLVVKCGTRLMRYYLTSDSVEVFFFRTFNV